MVGASDLNTGLRDNLNYLLSGRPIGYTVYEKAGDYTTTSATFGDVDATNLILSVTTASTRLVCWCSFMLSADNTASSGGEADLIVNSTTRAGGTNGLARVAQNTRFPFTIIGRWTGLTPGLNTIKLQFRNQTAGATTTINGTLTAGSANGMPITMFAMEY